ncbi:MAG: hypothetical protein EP338_12590 [Bacteroidetes bacterium]|nr:MAG: hypothetical protein EP338_12590 [Bacteroidota bacterium]
MNDPPWKQGTHNNYLCSRRRMKMRLYILALLFVGTLSAQDLVLDVRMNRMDFFTHVGKVYGNSWKQELGVGFAVNRTIFQQRIHPEVYYLLSRHLLRKRNFEAGFYAGFYSSTYELRKATHSRIYFQEFQTGPALKFGRRRKLQCDLGLGLALESVTGRKGYNHYLSYAYQIRLAYSLPR